ncbi:unnamed protein product [Paramecium primaurelia]|nr:unnamed protein product [Paramecium primaurelia]
MKLKKYENSLQNLNLALSTCPKKPFLSRIKSAAYIEAFIIFIVECQGNIKKL